MNYSFALMNQPSLRNPLFQHLFFIHNFDNPVVQGLWKQSYDNWIYIYLCMQTMSIYIKVATWASQEKLKEASLIL